jgi:hypothetical protein
MILDHHGKPIPPRAAGFVPSLPARPRTTDATADAIGSTVPVETYYPLIECGQMTKIIAEPEAMLADVNRRIRELRRGRYTCRPRSA